MKYFDNLLRLFAVILLGLAGFVSYQEIPVWKLFLVKDFSSLDLSVLLVKEQEKIGEVQFLNGSGFKRKMVEESFFKNLKVKDKVFSGDVVTTDESTRAVITLDDGGVLEIQPQSMVKLEFHRQNDGLLKIAKNSKVQVLTGSVKGTGGSKDLQISDRSGQTLVLNKNSSNVVENKPVVKVAPKVSLEKVKKLNLPQRVVAQEPVITPPVENVKPMEIKPVEETPVAKVQPAVTPTEVIPKAVKRPVVSQPPFMGSVGIQPAKIAGLSNLNSNTYNGEDLRNFFVNLKWEEVPGASGYEVLFFTDKNMTQQWFNVKTENNYYRLNQIFNGQLIYKVKALKGNKLISESKPANLNFNFQGPALKNPKHNTQLDKDETVYFFTWEKTNFTDKYILEISKDAQFSKIVKKESEQNFTQVPLLSGVYYWRVSSKHGNFLSSPSKVNTLYIK
jgi:hypothetical protein